MRIDFVIIGAQKAGTTSVAKCLALHPSICFCRDKEPHFFSLNKSWKNHIDNYHNLFLQHKGKMCCEASTSYSFVKEYPHVPAALFEYNPALKLIYILRDPVDRICSHYSHRLMRGLVGYEIQREILTCPDYIDRSLYGEVIQKYLEFFPPQQLYICLFDEMVSSPRKFWNQLYDFVGISSQDKNIISNKVANVSAGSNKSSNSPLYTLDRVLSNSPLWARRWLSRFLTIKLPSKVLFSKELETFLWKRLSKDVSSVENFVGIRLDKWRKKYEPFV